MNELFRDQLLKAGIVSKKQAKAAAHQENVARRQGRKGNRAEAEPGAAALESAREVLEQKRARDRELNLARAAAQQEQALAAQVNDLAGRHALKGWEGTVEYHFSDAGKVKTLRVSPAFQKELRDGAVGIVSGSGAYRLVPRAIALQIEERVPARLILLNDPGESVSEDDPYAAFPVPDDLMW